eukprot:4753899-Pleurochrysis_carterae.AAC.3
MTAAARYSGGGGDNDCENAGSGLKKHATDAQHGCLEYVFDRCTLRGHCMHAHALHARTVAAHVRASHAHAQREYAK